MDSGIGHCLNSSYRPDPKTGQIGRGSASKGWNKDLGQCLEVPLCGWKDQETPCSFQSTEWRTCGSLGPSGVIMRINSFGKVAPTCRITFYPVLCKSLKGGTWVEGMAQW
jgi:hypothetical protein